MCFVVVQVWFLNFIMLALLSSEKCTAIGSARKGFMKTFPLYNSVQVLEMCSEFTGVFPVYST